jgi:hypothetical protein
LISICRKRGSVRTLGRSSKADGVAAGDKNVPSTEKVYVTSVTARKFEMDATGDQYVP